MVRSPAFGPCTSRVPEEIKKNSSTAISRFLSNFFETNAQDSLSRRKLRGNEATRGLWTLLFIFKGGSTTGLGHLGFCVINGIVGIPMAATWAQIFAFWAVSGSKKACQLASGWFVSISWPQKALSLVQSPSKYLGREGLPFFFWMSYQYCLTNSPVFFFAGELHRSKWSKQTFCRCSTPYMLRSSLCLASGLHWPLRWQAGFLPPRWFEEIFSCHPESISFFFCFVFAVLGERGSNNTVVKPQRAS